MNKLVVLTMVLGVLAAGALGFAPHARAKELGTRQLSRLVQDTRTVRASIVRHGSRKMHEVRRETGRAARDGFSHVSQKVEQGLRKLHAKWHKIRA